MSDEATAASKGIRPKPSRVLRVGTYILFAIMVLWLPVSVLMVWCSWQVLPSGISLVFLAWPPLVIIAVVQLALMESRRSEVVQGISLIMTALTILSVGWACVWLYKDLFVSISAGLTPWVIEYALFLALLSLFIFILALTGATYQFGEHLTRHERSHPSCDRCGYDLHGTIRAGRPTCPECGNAIPKFLIPTPPPPPARSGRSR
jgi:hypothetical protein